MSFPVFPSSVDRKPDDIKVILGPTYGFFDIRVYDHHVAIHDLYPGVLSAKHLSYLIQQVLPLPFVSRVLRRFPIIPVGVR